MSNDWYIIKLMPNILDLFQKKQPTPTPDPADLIALHDATQKAKEILSSAELEASKVVSDTKFYRNKLDMSFEAQLDQTLEELREEVTKANQQYSEYLNYLKQESDRSRNENQEQTRNQINAVFTKFEENLSDFLVQTEQRSVQAIDLELRASRELIESYKQQQLKLVDENIIAMLERTLSLVLAKRLSLKEHIDLVYEALGKAKTEKFVL